MGKFVIITDASCDLSKKYRDEKKIEYVRMTMSWTDNNGKEHQAFTDLDWADLSAREFYDILRSGIRIYTAQVTGQDYINVFEKHLEKGEDVLYLACSSGLSASINAARLVADGELKERFPKNRVVVVDTLRAGMAQGSIVMLAQELKEKGKNIDEIAKTVEEERLKYKEVGIPESLSYLRRAGRVKASAAYFGNMIGLKPILVFDDKGGNVAIEKAIGKRKAFARMAEIIKDDIVDPENQDIYLMNADCKQEDIDAFKEAVLKLVKVRNFIAEPLGPIIGASSGPGTIIVNYKGK